MDTGSGSVVPYANLAVTMSSSAGLSGYSMMRATSIPRVRALFRSLIHCRIVPLCFSAASCANSISSEYARIATMRHSVFSLGLSTPIIYAL